MRCASNSFCHYIFDSTQSSLIDWCRHFYGKARNAKLFYSSGRSTHFPILQWLNYWNKCSVLFKSRSIPNPLSFHSNINVKRICFPTNQIKTMLVYFSLLNKNQSTSYGTKMSKFTSNANSIHGKSFHILFYNMTLITWQNWCMLVYRPLSCFKIWSSANHFGIILFIFYYVLLLCVQFLFHFIYKYEMMKYENEYGRECVIIFNVVRFFIIVCIKFLLFAEWNNTIKLLEV